MHLVSTKKKISVGVLAIQGSVEEHVAMLRRLNVDPVLVKNSADVEKIDGLIIPGGESTTIGKLMKKYGLDKAIRKRTRYPVPHTPLVVWGTCAGAILMSNVLRLMNIKAERNAYGRQIDSFETAISIPALGKKKVPAIFIRAPRLAPQHGHNVKILAQYQGSPVMLRQGNFLATAFHPELTADTRVHEYFLSMITEYAH